MDDAGAGVDHPRVARFLRDGAAVGGGVLLPGGQVLTCAHVVAAALGRAAADDAERPEDAVSVDFPLQGLPPVDGEVIGWCPRVSPNGGDLAVVRLVRVPADLAPMQLVARVPGSEELTLLGFPRRHASGVWKHDLEWAGPVEGGWIHLIAHGTGGYKLEAGFSGCPVFDASGAVVGVFVEAEGVANVDAGLLVPMEVAAPALLESDGLELPLTLPQPSGTGLPAATRVWNVPPILNRNFAGRDEELAELNSVIESDPVVALVGLGGAGKSQLAVQYAHRRASSYDVVWWVVAETEPTLVAGLAGLAAAVGLPEGTGDDQPAAVEALQRWLVDHDRWLLVYDNAAGPQAVRPWLPRGGAGHVLITSRHAAWGSLARVMGVGPLDTDEAAALLVRRSNQDDLAAAKRLAEALGGLALALEQAGAYLEVTGSSLADYAALLETRAAELLAYPSDSEERTVATTWALALEQLDEIEPAAADLLTVSAFFAPDDIPRTLFVDNGNLPKKVERLADPLAFGAALAALARYSLVTPAGNALALHRLVQTVVRGRLDEAEESAWAEVAVESVLTALTFDITRPETWEATARLLPHALQACAHAKRLNTAADGVASLLYQCGTYLQTQAQYAQAQAIYESAIADAEENFGRDDRRVAGLLNNLGLVLLNRGDLPGAEAAHKRALAITEALHGSDHPEVAIRMNNIGMVLRARSDLEGAEAAFRRALQIDEAAFGPDAATVAIDLNNLGIVLYDRRDLDGAEAAHNRALAIDEAEYGPDHPNVAVRMSNLGLIRHERGDLDGAEAAYSRALAIDEATYGPDHPHVAVRLNNLAAVRFDRGDLDVADATIKRALAIGDTGGDSDHLDVGVMLNTRAQILHARGELDAAAETLERALAIEEAAFGPDHPKIAIRLNNLAFVMRDRGDIEGARNAYQRALDITLSAYGAADRRTSVIRRNLEAL